MVEYPFPVRPGEHACCQTDHPQDTERLLTAFARANLVRGHKVLHLCDEAHREALAARLAADAEIGPAMQSGRFELRDAAAAYTTPGGFDADAMVGSLLDEQARALEEGYTGLSICGNVGAGLRGVAGADVAGYEDRLNTELGGDDRVLLCQYDHVSFDAGTLGEVAAVHRVVLSPALAAVGRRGALAAARVTPPDTLRLAGELDFEVADTVAGVLAEEFPTPRRVDAADLEYIDVAGMRALRGGSGAAIEISAASDAVRRLVALLGWDTDPAVEVVA
jgi:ABC-type transporter Mla MlaB component